MDLPAPQLAALVAVVDRGTFEAAARELHVTASAVSQRIRALESAVGQVLVRRASPCTATPAGATLVRLGRAQALLQAEVRTALEPDEGRRTELGLAVNADSLATWFRDVLAEAATWDDTVLRLEVEDQAHSHELLRRGETLAAVTSDPEPVQGCSVEPLGTMRYLPAAAPALLERHLSRGAPDCNTRICGSRPRARAAGDGAITATSTSPTATKARRTLEIEGRPSVPRVPGFSQMAA
ncbi:ArgP/LysG family DNA-binding transcriptional regulator [Nocardioides sp.]|uniref:ArgP/LysG family DNA-binding transcriptional regulator n=1 Tax=Nocardioides sp. TaxID=35761 RepID=UPI00351162F9